MRENTRITSKNHQLYTVSVNKKCLSAYDDKRYILEDGITTLPYGHYRVCELQQENSNMADIRSLARDIEKDPYWGYLTYDEDTDTLLNDMNEDPTWGFDARDETNSEAQAQEWTTGSFYLFSPPDQGYLQTPISESELNEDIVDWDINTSDEEEEDPNTSLQNCPFLNNEAIEESTTPPRKKRRILSGIGLLLKLSFNAEIVLTFTFCGNWRPISHAASV